MGGDEGTANRDRLGRASVLLACGALVLAMVAGAGVVSSTDAAPNCSAVSYAGSGTDQSPYEVRTLSELQCIGQAGTTLSDHYELRDDIDASDTGTWDGGFEPIGNLSNRFLGEFDGGDHTISNLQIDRGDEQYVGLFGVVGPGGTVASVGLDDVAVTGGEWTGALAGSNAGTVMDSYAAGSVEGSIRVGGLIGENRATVSSAYAIVDVDGSDDTGGLIGENRGTVDETYAAGIVSGSGARIGGLTGRNTAIVLGRERHRTERGYRGR